MAKASESSDMQYLKQDKIGRVIAQGLSQVYQEKPQKPVTFLAHWLLNHAENNKKVEQIQKKQSAKESHAQAFHTAESIKGEVLKKLKSHRDEEEDILKAFQDKIKAHEYHHQLLIEQFPEFLEKTNKFTGVYIGELDHPPREITESDTDPKAHLNTDMPKVINYIGSSKSHKSLMIGKQLPLDKGVTAEAFSLSLEDVEGEEKKKRFVYVPDVIKNQKVHFFRIPKLGAYIAVPLIYKSYLYDTTFDKALDEKKKYLQQKDEFDRDKTTQLEQIDKELDDARTKFTAHQQKNQTDQVTQVQEQIKEIEQRKADKQKQELEYTEPEMQTHKKQFVICADTLGQDREITQKEQEFLVSFVKKFKDEFEATELRLLRKDVDQHIDYEKKLQKSLEEFLTELEKQFTLDEQQVAEITEAQKEEKAITHQTNIIKLEKMKQQLNQEHIRNMVLDLKNRRVLKFQGLIQHLLYFLGYNKQQIDIPNTTHLNWKSTKDLATTELLKRLLAYDFREAKPNPVNDYAKVKYLESVLQKFPEDQVNRYNVGLGLILRIVKLLLTLRLEDVEIRRDRTEQLRNARNEKVEANQKIEDDKLTALDTHKNSLAPEDLESFNEVEWLKKYDEDNPPHEIPPEVVDDIDNDI